MLPWRCGLTVTRGPEADAEQRIRSAHRAIEIREKRRRVLSPRPALDYLAPQPPSSVNDAPFTINAIGPWMSRTSRSACQHHERHGSQLSHRSAARRAFSLTFPVTESGEVGPVGSGRPGAAPTLPLAGPRASWPLRRDGRRATGAAASVASGMSRQPRGPADGRAGSGPGPPRSAMPRCWWKRAACWSGAPAECRSGEDHCYCRSGNWATMTSAGPTRSSKRPRWAPRGR